MTKYYVLFSSVFVLTVGVCSVFWDEIERIEILEPVFLVLYRLL